MFPEEPMLNQNQQRPLLCQQHQKLKTGADSNSFALVENNISRHKCKYCTLQQQQKKNLKQCKIYCKVECYEK